MFHINSSCKSFLCFYLKKENVLSETGKWGMLFSPENYKSSLLSHLTLLLSQWISITPKPDSFHTQVHVNLQTVHLVNTSVGSKCQNTACLETDVWFYICTVKLSSTDNFMSSWFLFLKSIFQADDMCLFLCGWGQVSLSFPLPAVSPAA